MSRKENSSTKAEPGEATRTVGERPPPWAASRACPGRSAATSSWPSRSPPTPSTPRRRTGRPAARSPARSQTGTRSGRRRAGREGQRSAGGSRGRPSEALSSACPAPIAMRREIKPFWHRRPAHPRHERRDQLRALAADGTDPDPAKHDGKARDEGEAEDGRLGRRLPSSPAHPRARVKSSDFGTVALGSSLRRQSPCHEHCIRRSSAGRTRARAALTNL